jgi:hypothetical protein
MTMNYAAQSRISNLILQTLTVKEEIHCYSFQYSARLSAHPNYLRANLMANPTIAGDCEVTCQMICLPDS